MKKALIILFNLSITSMVFASGFMDMEYFQMDNNGGGGTGVPIDGGLTTVIVGSAVYGYRKVRKYFKENQDEDSSK